MVTARGLRVRRVAEGRGRIGLVYPRVALDSVPQLCQLVELCARQGYQVDVFTLTSPDVPDPVFDANQVRLVPLGEASVAGGGSMPGAGAARRLGPLKPLLAPLGHAYRAARQQWAGRAATARRTALLDEVARTHVQQPYTCFIGVDDDGLDSRAPWPTAPVRRWATCRWSCYWRTRYAHRRNSGARRASGRNSSG